MPADIMWYEVGDYTIPILVEGELLNGVDNDGPYLVPFFWLDAFKEGYWGLEWIGTVDEVQNYVTESYLASEFDTCGAKFLGIAGTNYVDLNGDGEAESIELLLEFDIGYPGYFDISMDLFSYPIDTVMSSFVYDFIYIDTPGVQTVSFILDGLEFYKQKFQGPMEIWTINVFSLGNATGFGSVYFSYQNGLFDVDYELLPGAAPAASIYSVDDYGIDGDGNGLYEYLAVSITLDVRSPQEFLLLMTAYGDASTGWWSYVGNYEQFAMAYEPGLISIELLIPASDIISNTYDGYTNYELWINLIDPYVGSLIESVGPIYTDWYFKSDFEVPVSIYDVFDYGEDVDANGLYEGIVVEVLIQVTTPGVFILDMLVFGDASTGYMTFVGFDSTFFDIPDTGLWSVPLFISAADINANVMDDYTDFLLEFHLLDGVTYTELVFLAPVFTDWYYKADFEATSTIFDVFDYGDDADANGLYEALILDVILDIANPGEYVIDVIVFGDESTGYMTEVGFYSVWFAIPDAGLWSVPVTVPSADILSSVTDAYTNFEVIIVLMDSEYNELDFLAPHYTNYYTISDFEMAWDYSTSYITYDADDDFCNDTIDIFADFAFYSLNNVTVDLYLDMWYWNETLANWTFIDTQFDGFTVTENPSFFTVAFNYQAELFGTHAFVLSIYIDGVFLDYETIYFYDACPYNP
jgi:hypothetical protein